MDLQKVRKILALGEKYSDEYVQQIIDQTEILVQIFIKQYRENKFCQNCKKSYNVNGDNDQKGESVHL